MEFQPYHNSSYQSCDFQEKYVRDELKTLKEKGDAQSYFKLATIYTEGHSVTRNHVEALNYAKLAQQQGDNDALLRLAQLYKGKGNVDMAKQCFTLAVNDFNHIQAAVELVELLYSDYFPDNAEIDKLSNLVKSKGNTEAQLALADCHSKHTTIFRDHTGLTKSLRESVVTRVQSRVRQQQAKTDLAQRQLENRAAITLQSAIRGDIATKNLKKKRIDNNCATRLQSRVREQPLRPDSAVTQFEPRVRVYKESEKADVPAYRDIEGKILGYEMGDIFVLFPPELEESIRLTSTRSITHESKEVFIITLSNANLETTKPDVIQLLQENHLEAMPIQYRINDTMVLSPNLGVETLWVLSHSGKYNYHYLHFKEMAENLDVLHAEGYAHRNIKPTNMHFYNGRTVLVGHYSVGVVGSFDGYYYTRAYITVNSLKIAQETDDNDKNTTKRDQYSCLLSMMELQFNEAPNQGRFEDHEAKVHEFVIAFNCSFEKKKELLLFLNDSDNNSLPRVLGDYFIEDGLAENKAATLFQANIRRKNLTDFNIYKESKIADVPAFRDGPDGEILGYGDGREPNDKIFPYKKTPAKLAKEGDSGGFKTVTHRNADNVLLTLKDPTRNTTPQDVIRIIRDKNLKTIVHPNRINNEKVMAPNLGEKNLRVQLQSGEYDYDYHDFIEAAEDLDIFHDEGFVHRDLKLRNMFFYKGRVVITDTDDAGRVGSFKNFLRTKNYVRKEFKDVADDNQDKTEPTNAWKRDNYSYLLAMMQAKFKETPEKGLFSDHMQKVKSFVDELPCADEKKKELLMFLTYPEIFDLSGGVAVYLKVSK